MCEVSFFFFLLRRRSIALFICTRGGKSRELANGRLGEGDGSAEAPLLKIVGRKQED